MQVPCKGCIRQMDDSLFRGLCPALLHAFGDSLSFGSEGAFSFCDRGEATGASLAMGTRFPIFFDQ